MGTIGVEGRASSIQDPKRGVVPLFTEICL